MTMHIEEHPLLDAACFTTTFPRPIAGLALAAEQLAALAPGGPAPLSSSDEVRLAVRDLLRVGGFKPTGRSKPASEYLVKATEEGWLAPDKGINAAVDACNIVSLHSGLPISVVDADLARPPWRLAIAAPGSSYVFNPAGQVIDLGGCVVLFDEQGPCGGPVKDSQRTKTHDGTVRTLSVIWGTRSLPGRTADALRWYVELLRSVGGEVGLVG